MKRNNFGKNHEADLTDQFHVEHYLPKLEKILEDNHEFLDSLKDEKNSVIEISSYNPISYEMKVLPVIEELLKRTKYNLNHSLPVVAGAALRNLGVLGMCVYLAVVSSS